MNLVKLEDLDVVPLVNRKLDKKKYGKLVAKSEFNETGKELSIDELDSNLVNNVISKPEVYESFMRPRYILVG